MKFRNIYILSMLFVSCAHNVNSISKREIGGFKKSGMRVLESKRNLSDNKEPLKLYVRQNKVTISPVEGHNETGSLFNVNDESNYLFASRPPLVPGKYLDVFVASNRSAKEKDNEAENIDESVKEEITDEEAKSLVESIPSLTPADPSSKHLLKKFRMKILRVFPNGDVLGVVGRSSENQHSKHSIDVSARIPYASLVSGRPLTTEDLSDVSFEEADGGEQIVRRSTSWEDEYSLRLSGFNEAESRYAQDLADKRKRLENLRKQLKNRIVAHGKERNNTAKQRAELLKEKSENMKKIDELQSKIAELGDAEGQGEAENEG